MSISHPNVTRLPEEPGYDAAAIVRVGSDRRLEALERLLAVDGVTDRAHVNRFIDFSRSNEIALDAMWSLVGEHDRLVHTVLAVPSPGRTTMFFASHPRDQADARAISHLIRHAAQAVASMDIHLAQALLDPAEVLERDAFLAAGFSELAKLSYMERSLPRTPGGPTPTWPKDVAVQRYDDSLKKQLLSVLEASYDQTLDCPALRGLRETRDILEGHRSTGVFDPALWTLLRVNGEPAGALLLNPSPTQKAIELVYLGLAPAARGRGLGKMLLQYGLALVSGRRERVINLAVDEQNEPALNLYRGEKFRRVLRRIALIRPLRSDAPSQP